MLAPARSLGQFLMHAPAQARTTPHRVTSCHVTQRHATPRHVTSHQVTSHRITSRHSTARQHGTARLSTASHAATRTAPRRAGLRDAARRDVGVTRSPAKGPGPARRHGAGGLLGGGALQRRHRARPGRRAQGALRGPCGRAAAAWPAGGGAGSGRGAAPS